MTPLFTPRTESLVQYILFGILVVATPFIVVTKYLQGVVHIVSHLSFTVFGREIPYVLSLVIIGAIAIVFWQLKSLTLRKILALGFIVIVIMFAHKVQDLYLGMSFFDLQQNWHYIAYGAYVFFFFRAFNARNMPKNKMILISFVSAIGMSTFDETFQFFMSHRIFDLSDIAKDALGAVFGLILVLYVAESYGTIEINFRSLAKKNLIDYFKDPLTALMIVFVFTMSYIIMTPLLTDHEYWHLCLLTGFLCFIVLFSIIHFSQYRIFRTVFISFVVLLILSLGTSFIINKDKNITYNSHNLTIYKGIPVPYYDLMIYPNGVMRLVDKKHHFRSQDKVFFLEQEPDILLIGSGSRGDGGKGFKIGIGTQFVYNRTNNEGVQVIILPSKEACEKFNELKEEGKEVLFVIHNSC